VSMAHWSGIGIPKTNAIALEVSYTHDDDNDDDDDDDEYSYEYQDSDDEEYDKNRHCATNREETAAEDLEVPLDIISPTLAAAVLVDGTEANSLLPPRMPRGKTTEEAAFRMLDVNAAREICSFLHVSSSVITINETCRLLRALSKLIWRP